MTAQRRTERLQDVLEAITALSGDSLSQLRLQGNADLATHVPGLLFRRAGSRRDDAGNSWPRHFLRTCPGRVECISMRLPLDIRTDGYAGAPDIDFFDVDRVEVLRGPQGTLYGSDLHGWCGKRGS